MTTLMNDVNEVDDSHTKSAANSSDASKGRHKLQEWLNKNMRIKLTDGRTLIGIFLCTDADCNIILGSCQEYLTDPDLEGEREEPRMLGLAMIPGHHIVSAQIDDTHYS